MSQVIRISGNLYQRLAAHAEGFETPSQVIERMVDFYEGRNNTMPLIRPIPETPTKLEIVYYPNNSVDSFKEMLINNRGAYIKLHYTNDTSEIIKWVARRFTVASDVEKNLRSGYLRNWRDKGIVKAELSINEADLLQE